MSRQPGRWAACGAGAVLPVLALLASLPAASAEDVVLSGAGLELAIDGATGAMRRLSYRGEALAEAAADRSPVTFGVGPAERMTWLEQAGRRQVVGTRRPSPDALELTVRVGEYELVERYRAHAGTPRLDRSVTLTWRGAEPVVLRAFAFKTFGVAATTKGLYRFPQAWPPASQPFAGMRRGGRRGHGGGVAPLVAELSPQRSLLWLSMASDPSSVRVEEGDGRFDVVQDLHAAGRLRPNQPQELGFVSLLVADAGYWDALPAVGRWMDDVGLRVPADTPPWVREAVLYCFHPGGTIGSGFKDLGGFAATTRLLLPEIPKTGANALWIMPIEQKSPYWPFNYYKLMDGLGTGDEYKALVRRAHDLGLHVWQDLVPHGGSPKAVHNVAHPEFMLRREDGSHLDYWLNDFAWPAWQQYVAGVAGHYVREYGIDGFRVDACGGSKEMNWSPDIPYARASHALLWGGIGMLRAIRKAVRDACPRDGAILAEAENARLMEVADAQYDFGFCYNLCHQWRRLPPAEFVERLRDYLEEQRLVEPRGTVRLRHVESHDSLRAELWYGVDGMRAMYALSAWIDGMPLIYHGMERGHAADLKAINDVRASRPELARGEARYRAVRCDAPGVFTCLRTLGDRTSVVAINFNREPVQAGLAWPGGQARVDLRPLGYAVVPGAGPPAPAPAKPAPLPDGEPCAEEALAFPDAREWFVDTLSGRLRDAFAPRPVASKDGWASGIYWRPQGTATVWQGELSPLHPARPLLGVRGVDGRWTIVRFDGPVPAPVRLVEADGGNGLRIEGLGGAKPRVARADALPPPLDPGAPFAAAGATLRCVGPDLVVSNAHCTVVLRRQGGAIRELLVGGSTVARDHDLYGDQDYLQTHDDPRIAAANDVECSLRIAAGGDGLRLVFEGQLRGFQRFSLKRPPVEFRHELVFGGGPSFRQAWAFRTAKTFKDRTAFLASIVTVPEADRFRFARGDEILADGPVGEGEGRLGATTGKAAPDRVELLIGGKPSWSLKGLHLPDGSGAKVFMAGRQLFVALLDGPGAAMEQGRWYGFEAEWQVRP